MTYPDTRLFIAGQWQDAESGKTIAVHNPATGQEIGRVAHAGIADLDRALEAAQKGFEVWRDTPAIERAKTMRRAAALMRERADAIAAILTQEQGKPRAEARVEAMAAADIIEWFADEGMRVYGRIVPSRNLAVRQMVVKDPVGVVAAFTPWNFPINQVVRKLGAALAAGCAVLVKAPEETPASPAELIRAFADAGVPAGAVGLVYGNPAEISNYLIPHPIVRKVTFTGSTPVGKQLAGLAGQHMKRVTMELGGHAPVIVCEDADIELAVKASGGAKFRNAGQVCISPTRFLVHESVRADFVAALTRHAQGLKVGDGLAEGTQMGPLANPRRVALGLDQNRLSMLLAVLHRHGGIGMFNQDVFVNVVGGVRIAETAADLPVLLAVLCGIPARAAELEPAYVRTVFHQTNGLPTDEANAVLQTRDGYLWVGSYGGLLRFDGSEFHNFSTEGAIATPSIRCLFE